MDLFNLYLELLVLTAELLYKENLLQRVNYNSCLFIAFPNKKCSMIIQ